MMDLIIGILEVLFSEAFWRLLLLPAILIRKICYPKKSIEKLNDDFYSNLGCGIAFWGAIIGTLMYFING